MDEYFEKSIRKVNERMISELRKLAIEKQRIYCCELQKDESGLTGYIHLERFVTVFPDGRTLFTFYPIKES